MRRTALAIVAAFFLGGFIQHTLAESAPSKLDTALVHLRYALAALNASPEDKEGHRKQAQEFTQKALEQVNKAIAANKKR